MVVVRVVLPARGAGGVAAGEVADGTAELIAVGIVDVARLRVVHDTGDRVGGGRVGFGEEVALTVPGVGGDHGRLPAAAVAAAHRLGQDSSERVVAGVGRDETGRACDVVEVAVGLVAVLGQVACEVGLAREQSRRLGATADGGFGAGRVCVSAGAAIRPLGVGGVADAVVSVGRHIGRVAAARGAGIRHGDELVVSGVERVRGVEVVGGVAGLAVARVAAGGGGDDVAAGVVTVGGAVAVGVGDGVQVAGAVVGVAGGVAVRVGAGDLPAHSVRAVAQGVVARVGDRCGDDRSGAGGAAHGLVVAGDRGGVEGGRVVGDFGDGAVEVAGAGGVGGGGAGPAGDGAGTDVDVRVAVELNRSGVDSGLGGAVEVEVLGASGGGQDHLVPLVVGDGAGAGGGVGGGTGPELAVEFAVGTDVQGGVPVVAAGGGGADLVGLVAVQDAGGAGLEPQLDAGGAGDGSRGVGELEGGGAAVEAGGGGVGGPGGAGDAESGVGIGAGVGVGQGGAEFVLGVGGHVGVVQAPVVDGAVLDDAGAVCLVGGRAGAAVGDGGGLVVAEDRVAGQAVVVGGEVGEVAVEVAVGIGGRGGPASVVAGAKVGVAVAVVLDGSGQRGAGGLAVEVELLGVAVGDEGSHVPAVAGDLLGGDHGAGAGAGPELAVEPVVAADVEGGVVGATARAELGNLVAVDDAGAAGLEPDLDTGGGPLRRDGARELDVAAGAVEAGGRSGAGGPRAGLAARDVVVDAAVLLGGGGGDEFGGGVAAGVVEGPVAGRVQPEDGAVVHGVLGVGAALDGAADGARGGRSGGGQVGDLGAVHAEGEDGDIGDLSVEVPIGVAGGRGPAVGGTGADEDVAGAVGGDGAGQGAGGSAVEVEALVVGGGGGQEDGVPLAVGDGGAGGEGVYAAVPQFGVEFAVGTDVQGGVPLVAARRVGGADREGLVGEQHAGLGGLEVQADGARADLGDVGGRQFGPRVGAVEARGRLTRESSGRAEGHIRVGAVVRRRPRRVLLVGCLDAVPVRQGPVARRVRALHGRAVGLHRPGDGRGVEVPAAAVGVGDLRRPVVDSVVGDGQLRLARRRGDAGQLGCRVGGGLVLGDDRGGAERVLVGGGLGDLAVEVACVARVRRGAVVGLVGPVAADESGAQVGLGLGDRLDLRGQGRDLGAVEPQLLLVARCGQDDEVPVAVRDAAAGAHRGDRRAGAVELAVQLAAGPNVQSRGVGVSRGGLRQAVGLVGEQDPALGRGLEPQAHRQVGRLDRVIGQRDLRCAAVEAGRGCGRTCQWPGEVTEIDTTGRRTVVSTLVGQDLVGDLGALQLVAQAPVRLGAGVHHRRAVVVAGRSAAAGVGVRVIGARRTAVGAGRRRTGLRQLVGIGGIAVGVGPGERRLAGGDLGDVRAGAVPREVQGAAARGVGDRGQGIAGPGQGLRIAVLVLDRGQQPFLVLLDGSPGVTDRRALDERVRGAVALAQHPTAVGLRVEVLCLAFR